MSLSSPLNDPTREEILNYIPDIYKKEEGFKDNFEIALYWFATLWHSGQSSNLYSILCASIYNPGRCATFESDMADNIGAKMLFDVMEYGIT